MCYKNALIMHIAREKSLEICLNILKYTLIYVKFKKELMVSL